MRRILVVGLLLTSACLGSVTPSAVASLLVASNISPSGVFVGDQIQLNASAVDITGAPVPAAVTFTSSNNSIAIVSTSGLISVLAPGSVTITIAAGGQSDRLGFTVDPNVSTTIQIAPVNPTIPTGSQAMLTATVITALGNPARDKSVIWSTADATKVSVDQSGNITGVAPTSGVAVCATAGDAPTVRGCTTVTVH
jgi:uncharacterized protein YjdB